MNMERTLFLLPLLMTALVAVAACGGSGDDDEVNPGSTETTATAAATDPESPATEEPTLYVPPVLINWDGEMVCELTTAEEMESVSGRPYFPGVPSFNDCSFWARGNTLVTITLGLSEGPAAAEEFENTVVADGFEEIEGAGERAAWNAGRLRLDVLSGDRILHVVPSRHEEPQALAIAIANTILAQ